MKIVKKYQCLSCDWLGEHVDRKFPGYLACPRCGEKAVRLKMKTDWQSKAPEAPGWYWYHNFEWSPAIAPVQLYSVGGEMWGRNAVKQGPIDPYWNGGAWWPIRIPTPHEWRSESDNRRCTDTS